MELNHLYEHIHEHVHVLSPVGPVAIVRGQPTEAWEVDSVVPVAIVRG